MQILVFNKEFMIDQLTNIDCDLICFETTGSVTVGGKLLLDNLFSKKLIKKYPLIEKLLAFKLIKTKKNIPYFVGALNDNFEFISITSEVINNKLYKFLLCSFPTKNKTNEEDCLNLKNQSSLILKDYLNSFKISKAAIINSEESISYIIL